MSLRILAAAALLALAACAKTDPTEPLPRLLSASAKESMWREKAPANYSFVRTRFCFCLEVDPRRVTVRDGVITSIVNLRTQRPEAVRPEMAIDSLFALIRREALDLPEWLEVSYDDRFGYPTRVAYGRREVDAGGIITIDSLRAER